MKTGIINNQKVTERQLRNALNNLTDEPDPPAFQEACEVWNGSKKPKLRFELSQLGRVWSIGRGEPHIL